MAEVLVTDVYLRDGLQDEPVFVSIDARLQVAQALIHAGVRRIEVGSFVSEERVPQMAGAASLVAQLPAGPRVDYAVLALNRRGVERAISAGAKDITFAVSASNAHSHENAGRSTTAALRGLREAVSENPGVGLSAAVATAFTCPFEGVIPLERLAMVVRALVEMGIRSIDLADTLGDTPTDIVIPKLHYLKREFTDLDIGLHLHNAKGQAIETALQAADMGISRFDAALAGFGGCPFAPGAAGNVATEQLVRALHQRGHDTGIDEEDLADAVDQALSAVRNGARFQ